MDGPYYAPIPPRLAHLLHWEVVGSLQGIYHPGRHPASILWRLEKVVMGKSAEIVDFPPPAPDPKPNSTSFSSHPTASVLLPSGN